MTGLSLDWKMVQVEDGYAAVVGVVEHAHRILFALQLHFDSAGMAVVDVAGEVVVEVELPSQHRDSGTTTERWM